MKELALFGLGSRTPVSVTGSRHGELEAAIRCVWSRCLSAVDSLSLVESEPLTVGLTDTNEQHPENGIFGSSLPALLQLFTQEVTRTKITAQKGKLFLFHASAVAHPQSGNTVAFVAPGGTGKTTLVSKLAREFSYVTDETVAVDAELQVYAYPKPLSMRTDSPVKQETDPHALGLCPLGAHPRLGRVVVLQRSEGHDGPPEATHLTLHDALFALAPETSSLSQFPLPLQNLEKIFRRIPPCVVLRYREVDSEE